MTDEELVQAIKDTVSKYNQLSEEAQNRGIAIAVNVNTLTDITGIKRVSLALEGAWKQLLQQSILTIKR